MSIKGVDLTGKRVSFRKGVLSPEYEGMTAIATGGFGCSPTAVGSAVFVLFDDGETARFDRSDIDSVVEE